MRRRAETKQRGAVARAPPAPGVSAVGDRRQGASRAGAPCRRWDRSLRPPLPQGSMSVLVGIRIATEKEEKTEGGEEVVGRKRTIAYSCILFCFLTIYIFFAETVEFRFMGHKENLKKIFREIPISNCSFHSFF